MRIVMMTNTYKPIVGGLEKSVETFTEEYRRLGHRVLVVAPHITGEPKTETDVIRLPAIQHFVKTDFALHWPAPGELVKELKEFSPDIVHSHHPFLIGETAVRLACRYDVPLVFTHHTLFEQNTYYFSASPRLRRFAVRLATGYANLADRVFAPSSDVKEMLRRRGVFSPIEVVPTGIDEAFFASGDARRGRARHALPESSLVVGYAGRLVTEKNLDFLARAVALFLKCHPDARFLIVGDGPRRRELEDYFAQAGLDGRAVCTGVLTGPALADAYAAMDVFAFASKSETQGMVLLEAMAAGKPVVALAASAVSDVLSDGENGRLCPAENEALFADLLEEFVPVHRRLRASSSARKTSLRFTSRVCAEQALSFYAAAQEEKSGLRRKSAGVIRQSLLEKWRAFERELRADWALTENWAASALAAAQSAGES